MILNQISCIYHREITTYLIIRKAYNIMKPKFAMYLHLLLLIAGILWDCYWWRVQYFWWIPSKAILDVSTTSSLQRRLLCLPVLKFPSKIFFQLGRELVLGEFSTSRSFTAVDLLWYSPICQVTNTLKPWRLLATLFACL